jgi:IS5 family transposase
VIFGAMCFRNEYDGHTLPPVIEQVKKLTGKYSKIAKVDRGYRGRNKIGEIDILIPLFL